MNVVSDERGDLCSCEENESSNRESNVESMTIVDELASVRFVPV